MDNTYAMEMESDIRDYIENEIRRKAWIGYKEELEEYLNVELFCSYVTGGDCADYYHNKEQAKETVFKNMDLLRKAFVYYPADIKFKMMGRKFIEEDWEYFDATIRRYVLPKYIRLVLDDLDKEGYFDDDEVEL